MDKDFKKAKIRALEILYTLINNFPRSIKNVDDIVDACIGVYYSLALYEEKTKALDVVTLILDKIVLPMEVADKINKGICELWMIKKGNTGAN